MADPSGKDAQELRPVLIEAGRIKRKALRKFRKGGGPLMDDVQQALAQVRQTLGADAAAKELVPVVLVYRKRGTKRSGRLPFPFPFPLPW